MEHMEIRNAEKGDEEILAWVQTESFVFTVCRRIGDRDSAHR